MKGLKLCYILYLPETPGERMTLWHMVDAGGENFVFWFTRTQEEAFLDTFQRILFLCHKCFFVQQNSGGTLAPGPPVAWAQRWYLLEALSQINDTYTTYSTKTTMLLQLITLTYGSETQKYKKIDICALQMLY